MVAVGGMPATEQDGAAAGHGGSLPGTIAAAVGSRVPERKETAGGGSQARVYRKLLWVSVIGIRVAGTETHRRESFRHGALRGRADAGGHSDAARITARSRSITEQT